MHTVEVLEHALDLAVRLGYSVRQEWLAASGGGACELNGRKLLFLDLDLSADERLEQVVASLQHDPDAPTLPMPHELRELLKVRKVA